MSNEQQNTREEAANAAINAYSDKHYLSRTRVKGFEDGYCQGFDAGAASVDRAGIVEKSSV